MAPKPGGQAAPSEENWKSPEAFAGWTESLLGLEKQAEDEETSELLVSCSQSELQARGIAILKLVVAEQSTALYGRTSLQLERPHGEPLPAHRISQGDIVGIFDQTQRPLNKAVPLVSGVVQRVRSASISLVFDADIPVEVLDGRHLQVAAVSSEVTLKRYKDVLDALKKGKTPGPSEDLVDVCFGNQKPHFYEAKSDLCGRADAVDCEFRADQSRNLNDPQQAAVVKALRAKDMVVIHGPPGTGKTTTLVAYILEAVYRKQRLLVCAPSNVAVDNLLERVVACGFKSVVRLGHPARVQSEVHAYTMDNVVYSSDQAALCRDIKKEIDEALKRFTPSRGGAKAKAAAKTSPAQLNELRKDLRQRERRAVSEVLRKTQVVFATCAGAAALHREIKKGGDDIEFVEFDVVVIDEAAQALEVACWIPMLLGRKAVLAGDHQQLAACVKSSEAQKQGLDRTLFARMVDEHGDYVAALLSIQYRMNSVIMGWSSRFFYDGRLEAAESVSTRLLELNEVPAGNLIGETVDAMRAPMLFVDTGGLPLYREDGADQASDKKAQAGNIAVHQSRGNLGEARFVVHYAKQLIKCGILPKDVTVITPYNRQVDMLRTEFAEDADAVKLGLEKPRINTVDSFQGQEADAVLIPLVRSNDRGVVGFLSDYRRLNVAVTRARKHVMIIGDAATICSDDTLGSLYDYACEKGRVVFVHQLLDEDGNVPPDPAAAAEQAAAKQERNAAAVKKLEQSKERRQEKKLDEEEVRKRFDNQLRPLLEEQHGKRYVFFPASLNPFERAMAHEVAKELGLLHESTGEGMERRLLVWAAGADVPPMEELALEGGGANKKKKKNKKAAQDSTEAGCAEAEDEDESETALQAFERRAAALLDSLGAANIAAEWKAPSEEEMEVLRRLVAARDLQLTTSGSGKKHKCRIELQGEALAKAEEEATATAANVAAAASREGYSWRLSRKPRGRVAPPQAPGKAQMSGRAPGRGPGKGQRRSDSSSSSSSSICCSCCL
eukprot:TRINITY_DN11534_c0_g2_i7.p1 TRINITY_DN11534_c0_g2~~TRINITY_DN11534_c0_g2_i7.p1  ORF type:complete len:1008 (-),score=307.70 TRINITY_DN11534_c0_g2_i7:199-3222(-)